MRALASLVGLVSSLALACAAGAPRPLKVSKEPFENTGLHHVELQGRGELLVAPDLERVRKQIRETEGAILRCQVTVAERLDSSQLAGAKQTLERELCAEVQRNITARPRPQVGAGSETPSRVTNSPGPGIMFVEAWLLGVEGDAARLAPTSKSIFSLRLSESQGGKPVMRYYEPLRSAASEPLGELVDGSMERLYGIYEQVLNSEQTDVAAPPR
jgi:hypothetical protein